VIFYLFPLIIMEAQQSAATETAPAAAAPAPANGPIKVFRIEDISVSIFARDRRVRGEDVTFYSVSVARSYLDAQGVRQYTKSFDPVRHAN